MILREGSPQARDTFCALGSSRIMLYSVLSPAVGNWKVEVELSDSPPVIRHPEPLSFARKYLVAVNELVCKRYMILREGSPQARDTFCALSPSLIMLYSVLFPAISNLNVEVELSDPPPVIRHPEPLSVARKYLVAVNEFACKRYMILRGGSPQAWYTSVL